jgi:hypothetical protein
LAIAAGNGKLRGRVQPVLDDILLAFVVEGLLQQKCARMPMVANGILTHLFYEGWF